MELREIRGALDMVFVGDTRVVDNHVVRLDTCRFVFFCHFTEGVQEKPVAQLHDISLVDASDFLGIMPGYVREWYGRSWKHTLRSFLRAKSKAKREMRSALAFVITFRLSTTPG